MAEAKLWTCTQCGSKVLFDNVQEGTTGFQPRDVEPIKARFLALSFVKEVETKWSIDETWKVLVTMTCWIGAEVWDHREAIYELEQTIMDENPTVDWDFSVVAKGTS